MEVPKAIRYRCRGCNIPAPKNPQRIVGGSVTYVQQWPSMVAGLFSNDLVTYRQECGGTILNNRSVLTAAHCTFGYAANRWRLRVGSTWANSGGVVHNVQSIINHPNYNDIRYNNDIAIFRSASTFTYNYDVVPVLIAGANYNLADNQSVWATGWGNTISSIWSPSDRLRQVEIRTVNQAVCTERYAAGGIAITDNMLCAGWLDVGGRGQCQGDSGGPLYHSNVQVGITSFANGCAQAYYPGVNTRVSRYTAWIQSNA